MSKIDNKHAITSEQAKAKLVHEALRLRAEYLTASKATFELAIKTANKALDQGRSPAFAVFSGSVALKSKPETIH